VTTEPEDIFDKAYADALLYGVGLIRIANTKDGPTISHVPREEFMDMAQHLKHVVENTLDFTDVRPKS
jgi:hypothetical protein